VIHASTPTGCRILRCLRLTGFVKAEQNRAVPYARDWHFPSLDGRSALGAKRTCGDAWDDLNDPTLTNDDADVTMFIGFSAKLLRGAKFRRSGFFFLMWRLSAVTYIFADCTEGARRWMLDLILRN